MTNIEDLEVHLHRGYIYAFTERITANGREVMEEGTFCHPKLLSAYHKDFADYDIVSVVGRFGTEHTWYAKNVRIIDHRKNKFLSYSVMSEIRVVDYL